MPLLQRLYTLLLIAFLATGVGCAGFNPRPVPQNPFYVAAQNQDDVWEQAVDVVHDYFEIARENRLEGVIETKPKVGSSVFEPWHRETRGWYNRMESSLQSIRRRAFIRLEPAEAGYLVSVEVFKELEDLSGPANTTAGGATFQTNNPLRRDLNLVVGQAAPSGWIILGRDEELEREMLSRLQAVLPTPGGVGQ